MRPNKALVAGLLAALAGSACDSVDSPARLSARQDATAPPPRSAPAAKPPTNRINPTQRDDPPPPAPAPPRARAAAPFDSPPRAVDFGELLFEATFSQADFDARRMNATVTYTIWPREDQTSVLTLHAVDMQVTRVEVGSDFHEANFLTRADSIEIDLEGLRRAGEGATVRVHYTVTQPQLGLYFAGRGDDFNVYTFSESQQARFWLPCHDFPDTRWSACETRITVPEGFSAVSVGAPLGAPRPAAAGGKTYVWRLNTPIDPHLYGFVVGRFKELRDESATRVPVFAYVQPQYESEARAVFAEVPRVLAYYESLVGVPYPFPQFSHVSTPGHFHGGMEQAGYDNISPDMFVTIGTSDRTRYEYVAHMIGHAWFGGITNYAHVTEAWLNEGFATYLHLLWRSQTHDFDAFDKDMVIARRRIIGADVVGKSKPLVNTTIRTPDEIYGFGGGLIYFKGAWVLHMLRHELGDALFWRGVREFLERYRGRGVVTDDLRETFESVSGRDLAPFFRQWVGRGGVPHVSLARSWDAARGVALLRVRQTQRIDAEHPPFFFPLTVAFETSAGRVQHTLAVTRADETFEVPASSEPSALVSDPGVVLLARFEQ